MHGFCCKVRTNLCYSYHMVTVLTKYAAQCIIKPYRIIHILVSKTYLLKEEFFMTKELPACPVETTLMLISDRWKVLIIRDLLEGTKRFGELKKSVGNISQKVLTANLRSMEEAGLLTRKVYPEVPPRVEYTLTETGYSLKPVLDAMVAWGTEYKEKSV